MTNLEGRVLRLVVLSAPPPGVRTDLDIFKALADRLGCSAGYCKTEPSAVFDELRRAAAAAPPITPGLRIAIAEQEGCSGLVRMRRIPAHLACSSTGFRPPTGAPDFNPVEYRGPAEIPDRAFPYILTTGRVLSHYQTGAQTRRVRELREAEPEAFVEINARHCARAWRCRG